MNRSFNTEGSCDADIHYMLPPTERLKDVKLLIDKCRYFVVVLMLACAFAIINGPVLVSSQAWDTVQWAKPASGQPGTHFFFAATGFAQHEPVAYWFNAPDGRIYGNQTSYIVTAYQGRATWTWQAPHNAMPGMWSAVAQGVESGVTQVLSFGVYNASISPQAPSLPHASIRASSPGAGVVPQAGCVDTTFWFYSDGFLPSEYVGVQAEDPRGYTPSMLTHNSIKADPEGRIAWQWRVPLDTFPGKWRVAMQGQVSQREKTIVFEVLGPESPALCEGLSEPYIGVEPSTGAPGTRFRFYAVGFSSYEEAHIMVFDAFGHRQSGGTTSVKANYYGRADWQWTVDIEDPPGLWSVQVQGEASSVERSITFQVCQPFIVPPCN